MPPSDLEHCRHEAGGKRCQSAIGLSEAGLCFSHDPLRETERLAARSLGGKRKAEKVGRKNWMRTIDPEDALSAPQTIDDAAKWAAWGVRAVATGLIDHQTGRETATMLKTFIAAIEKSALANRVAELERALAEAKAERTRLKVAG